jgi:tRNA pseudouridine38-40 synthase
MPRYRIDIEYDGGPYAGWQRQADLPTVQAAIETAIHAFTGESVTIRGAGRTDAGVHATAQVAHVDLAREWQPNKMQGALNAHLASATISTRASRPRPGTISM